MTPLPQNQFLPNPVMPTTGPAVAFSDPSGSDATAALIQSSDRPGGRVEDNPRPHGESLQQGLDTSSKPGTAHRCAHGEGSAAASVANPEEYPASAPHIPPGLSEAIPSNEGRSDGAPALDAPPNAHEDAGATDHICEIFAGAAKIDDRRFVLDEHAFLDAIELDTGFQPGDISWRLERRA